MEFFQKQNMLLSSTQNALAQLQKLSSSILACSDRISANPEPFQQALSMLYRSSTNYGSKVIITAVGKSAKIGEKIAATLISTGTLAIMMHSTEALHGDLGLVRPGDTILAISYSGNTHEVMLVVEQIKKKRAKLGLRNALPSFASNDDTVSPSPASQSESSSIVDFSFSSSSCERSDTLSNLSFGFDLDYNMDIPIIALCGNPDSQLVKASDVWLDISVECEASPLVPAPTFSTTVTLAMGDILAMNLMDMINFKHQDFLESHPGGSLGKNPITNPEPKSPPNSQFNKHLSASRNQRNLETLVKNKLQTKNPSQPQIYAPYENVSL